jgi:hypothetical protein
MARRASRIVRLGLPAAVLAATAACGLDVAGTETGAGDAGSSSSGGSHGGSSSASSGTAGDDGSGADDTMSDGGGGASDDGPGSDAFSTGPGDGGSRCNFGGRWATKLTIPVNWVPQGITSVILAPGVGAIEQWILSDRTLSGLKTTDSALVCGIKLPDFSGTGFAGGETYGVRFPDSLFDNGFIPTIAIVGVLGDTTPTATFTTQLTPVLLGLTLANPTTAAWPATISTAVDTDKDMEPGVTANAAIGPIAGGAADGGSYQPIPVDVFGDRASEVYVVIRQVTALSGGASDCDHMSGSVTIPKIPDTANGKYAIDSHVIGCGLAGGTGDCSAMQIGFVDGTQPVFTPTAGATFTSVRMPTGTCASARQALP